MDAHAFVMLSPHFTYRPMRPWAIPLPTQGASVNPIVRVWSSRPIEHPFFVPTDMRSCEGALLWFLLCDPCDPKARTLADAWRAKCTNASLLLTLNDSVERCLLAVRDVVLAMQCDWTHFAMADADMSDLVNILGRHQLGDESLCSTVRMGTCLSNSAADTTETLRHAWHQLEWFGTRQVLLLRTHAIHDFEAKSVAFASWRKLVPHDLRVAYWDLYDPMLQLGQKRFTFLVAE